MRTSLKAFLFRFIKKFRNEIIVFNSILFLSDFLYIFVGGYILKIMTNRIENNNFEYIELYGILYCFIIVFSYLSRVLRKNIEYKFRRKIDKEYVLKYFSKILKHENEYFSDNLSGQLTTKLFNIQKKLEHLFGWSFDAFGDIFLFFIGVVILYFITPALSYFCIVWFAIYSFITVILLKQKFRISDENAEKKSKSIGIINDCFTNVMNVKMFAKEKSEYRRVKRQSVNILRNESKILMNSNILNIFNYLSMSIFIFGTFGIIFIEYINSKTSIGNIMFVSQFNLNIVYWISYAFRVLFKIIDDISVINNSIKTLAVKAKISNKIGAKNIQVNSGKIIFKNVEFNYEK